MLECKRENLLHITIVSRCSRVFSKLHRQEKKIPCETTIRLLTEKHDIQVVEITNLWLGDFPPVNISNNKNASRWMTLAYKALAKYLVTQPTSKVQQSGINGHTKWSLFLASSCWHRTDSDTGITLLKYCQSAIRFNYSILAVYFILPGA